jgi:glyceraldehyde 3-phosphate dehydrogenase
MSIKIAINGYGRIGKNILRAIYENYKYDNIQVVAINDLIIDINHIVYLTKYDSTHGIFNASVSTDGKDLIINNNKIKIFNEKDPSKLPWNKLNIDIVCECTGYFTSKNKAQAHINAGAKKVLISAPGNKDIDNTIVYGVNHNTLRASDNIISNASCTTNCLAPIAKVLNDTVGIESGLMTTIHSYTNDQKLLDVYHEDIRRARSATTSMIPTKTGSAASLGLVIPELSGKINGFAMRVPTLNVSVVDLTFVSSKKTSISEINQIIENSTKSFLKDIVEYNIYSLVSIDFNHNSHSAIFDSTQTMIIDNLVKILAWYDNEWGFSNRMLDIIQLLEKFL